VGRGVKAPWVDVGQMPIELEKRLQVARIEARRERREIQLDPITEKERQETAHGLLAERADIIRLLHEFYQSRSVPNEQRLIIYPFGNSARLTCQGAAIQSLYPQEVQAEKLAAFQ